MSPSHHRQLMSIAKLSTTLVLIFLVLKLTGVINWSWWYVFAPWIAEVGFVAVLFGIVFIAIRRNR